MNLFPRNFDLERQEAAILRQPQPPAEERFSAADVMARITAARQAAFAEGHAAGHAEGSADALRSIEAEAAETAARIVAQLQDLKKDMSAHRQSVERDLLAFLSRAADTLLPDLEDAIGPARFEAEVRALAQRVVGSERVHIRVAPANLPRVQQLIRSAAPETPEAEVMARFTLAADPALDPTAVAARWQEGGSDHSFRKVCGAIRSLLATKVPGLSHLSAPAVFRSHPRAPAAAQHSMTGNQNG